MTPLALHTVDAALQWLRERTAASARLQPDSRAVGPGDVFVAWPGFATDGRRFVADALARGASACLVEAEGVQAFELPARGVATLKGLKRLCGPLASAWHGDPSRQLDVMAVTGTNGKTSTAWWLAQVFNRIDRSEGRAPGCGLVGTLGIGIADDASPLPLADTGMTTPDPMRLQAHLADLVRMGGRACAMEASSIGLAEGRLDGTSIRTALFTNFTQDHLDYHGTMQAYWAAKTALFDWPTLESAVVCVDDPRGAELLRQLHGRALDIWTVGLHEQARLRATDLRYGPRGIDFTVLEAGQRQTVQTALVGEFNVVNLLGVLAALRQRGWSLEQAAACVAAVSPVPGRMEFLLEAGQPAAVIDYAHTPDALEKALRALRPVTRTRGGQLWCVFGCGGNRDTGKRPLMAAAAERHADRVVLTSDNPRQEDPLDILRQTVTGLSRPGEAVLESDRARAIDFALQQADVPDVVLIAGKGHEAYQEVAGVRHPFSDRAHALAALGRRSKPPLLEKAPA